MSVFHDDPEYMSNMLISGEEEMSRIEYSIFTLPNYPNGAHHN